MDIELDFGHAKGGSSAQSKRNSASHNVQLEDASVFNLSDYADYYSGALLPFSFVLYTMLIYSNHVFVGRRKIQRLMFIGRSCPALAVEAFRLAAEAIKADTMDVGLYEEAVTGYQAALDRGLQDTDGNKLQRDDEWISNTRRAAQKESDKLEVELKSYQSNLIKESIRVRLSESR